MKETYLQPRTEVYLIGSMERFMAANSINGLIEGDTGITMGDNDNEEEYPEEGDVKEFIFEEDPWEDDFYYGY